MLFVCVIKTFIFCYFSASSEHSFSSDSSHDYCVPPESISPPEPPNNYGDVYDEVADLYAEVNTESECGKLFSCKCIGFQLHGQVEFFGNSQ